MNLLNDKKKIEIINQSENERKKKYIYNIQLKFNYIYNQFIK
jgi:hypothetical protein